MRAFVTGGSGVVGSALLRHVADSGHDAVALVRSDRAAATVSELGASPVFGDVLDVSSFESHMSDCEVVFHVAGVNEMCSRDPDRMWRVNVDGARNVLAASAGAGVRRLVHTSSAVTLGERAGTVGNEDSPHRGHFLSEYERSKTVAERILLDSSDGVEVVAVNPSSVQGPGRASGTGALLLALVRGDLPVLVDATISLVDIDDCARGHLLAAEHGVPGERYVLSGEVLSMRDALRLLDEVRGWKSRPWFLRSEVVAGLADVLETLGLTVSSGMSLCAESLRVLLHGHEYDGSKAANELGLRYTPARRTLERTVDWLGAEGLLRR